MVDHTSEIDKRIRTLINQGESSEVEFKSARGGFPGSFWESYSAFANTNGGTIVLGVVEKIINFYLMDLQKKPLFVIKRTFGIAHITKAR